MMQKARNISATKLIWKLILLLRVKIRPLSESAVWDKMKIHAQLSVSSIPIRSLCLLEMIITHGDALRQSTRGIDGFAPE